MEKPRVIIIGAGASGLAAACAAAEAGARVTIIEKNHVPGRKIRSTGAGKCNLTNAQVDAKRYHGGTDGFLPRSFKALPAPQVRRFFEDLGLLTVEEEDGRIFPRSMKAADVAAALTNFITAGGVELKLLTEAVSVTKTPAGFEVTARPVPPRWESGKTPGPASAIECDTVILAAGGPAYPQIGGTAAGYELAGSLGHSIIPARPVLVPLKVKEAFIRQADGVRVQARAELLSGGKPLARGSGELLFTKYGLSGPLILDLSRAAVFARGAVKLRIDLFPEYTEKTLAALLSGRREKMADRFWRDFLCGLADERLMLLISERAGAGQNKLVSAVPDKVFREFARLLKALEFELDGPLGFEDAMVSAGGVKTSEIDPATFGSFKTKGLFITGELLDIDGDSGGFNLHFAWTSGLLAGRAAAIIR